MRRGAAFVAAGIVLAACTKQKDVCEDLQDRLAACGLEAAAGACSAADESVREDLLQRVEQRGCEGISDGSGAVDPRLCKLNGWACPDAIGPAPSGARPVGPVVFVGGIGATPAFDWSPWILEGVRDLGEVHHVSPTAWATTPERAADLWAEIERIVRGRDVKVNLVCYAVGGLDCRFVASPAGLFADDAASAARARAAIASITTVSTPHRGTRVADAALAVLESDQLAEIVASLTGQREEDVLPRRSAIDETLRGLTLDAGRDFARVVDADGVFYQSLAGVSHPNGKASAATRASIAEHCVDAAGAPAFYGPDDARDAMHPLLLVTAPFGSATLDADGRIATSPTDGMIAVESAKHGLFRGCVPADHYDVIGQIAHTTRDPRTGFDPIRFYRWILSDLAERGF